MPRVNVGHDPDVEPVRFRPSRETRQNMKAIGVFLERAIGRTISTSLMLRRAIEVYYDHLSNLDVQHSEGAAILKHVR